MGKTFWTYNTKEREGIQNVKIREIVAKDWESASGETIRGIRAQNNINLTFLTVCPRSLVNFYLARIQ